MPASTTRTYRGSAAAPVSTRKSAEAFADEVRFIARRLLFSVQDLTSDERDWLSDLARDEVRYPMVTVRRLCAVSRRSRTVEDREAFAELIRAESTPVDGAPSLPLAFDLETAAPGPADVAQRAYERAPCPSTFARCRETLLRQLVSTRDALNALAAHWRNVAPG